MDPPTVSRQTVPYLTDDLSSVGGAIKRFDEDFLVEEVSLYGASGEGTHVYFLIEKRGLPTPAVIGHVARALGRNAHEIGYAGLKDAHGITRQWLSIEHEDPHRIASLSLGRVRVLKVTRHGNKIKLGHLAGNRFTIKIREAVPLGDREGRGESRVGGSTWGLSAMRTAESVLAVLARRGVPNYFGPQRFGVRGDNARIGRAILVGDHQEALTQMLGRPGPADRGPARRARELFDAGDFQGAADAWPRGTFSQQARICRALLKNKGNAAKAFRVVDRTMQRLYVSAFQSELFNRVLARRIEGLDRVMIGDLAWKHDNGACFRVEDAGVEQPRCASFEISPTGPIFGRRMTEASGEPGRIESEVLSETGLSRDGLSARHVGKLDGARRPLRVPLADWKMEAGLDERGAFLSVSFFLPAGAYATNVIREISKADPSAEPPCEEPLGRNVSESE